MPITKKIIGRVPVCFGTWYSKVGGWDKKNRVTLYGSEFESLHDGNTTAPATYDEVHQTVTFNETDWMVISNGTDAWLAATKINDLGTWTSNVEYLRVYTDSEGKVLFGIKADGSIEWAKGIPSPIKKELEKIVGKIDEGITERVDALEKYVDDTFGKVSENEEYIRIYTDSEGKLLWGIKVDGSVEWSKGVPYPVRQEIGKVRDDVEDIIENLDTYVENEEYIHIITDSEGKLLFGIKEDGSIEWSVGIPTPIRKVIEEMKEQIIASMSEYIDSEEYIHIIRDNEGKVLFGIKTDGSVSWAKGVPSPIKDYTEKAMKEIENYTNNFEIVSSPEYIYAVVDADRKFIFGVNIDGEFVTWKSKNNDSLADISDIAGFFDSINDKEERIELTLDKDNKVISYRTKEGVKVEKVGLKTSKIETDSLNLSSSGMSEFQKALKNAGFNPGGTGDWSDYISQDGEYPLNIAEPRCAMLNIISDMNLSDLNKKGLAGAVKGVNYDVPAEVEFFDMQGNYFHKNVLMSAQGQSSMNYEKKNMAFDFFDTEVDGDAFKIRFGNWVAQDSFHVKAYVADFFKGLSVICYQISEEVAKTRGFMSDTPWKRALWSAIDFDGSIYKSEQIDDMSLQMDSGAKCQPDGFPVLVYHNGEFYGLFSWTLKKHRDNYHMSKSSAKNIHVDGQYYDHKLFDGDIAWNMFEPRNPKDLYYKEAHLNTETHKYTYKYDADNPGQFEIADQVSVDAWIAAGQLPDGTEITNKIKKNLQNTAKVHTAITNLSGRLAEIEAQSTVEAKKALIETYFDVPSLIDYELIQCAVADPDSIFNNCQWITYDGVKWYACEYDKDDTFGNHHYGNMPREVGGWTAALWSNNQIADKSPIGLVRKYYQAEAKARWQELVSAGIFTTSHFMELINNWMNRIGENYYAKEYEKWPDSISDRDTNFNTEYWEYETNEWNTSVAAYSSSRTYSVGERCSIPYASGYSFIFKAVQSTTGNAPTTGSIGWRGSIGQIYAFIENNFEKENQFFESL